MSYNAIVVQVMVSGPSDLPREHVSAIHTAMRKWNVELGRIFAVHFSPTDWLEGASPAFGPHAQAVLNAQIVRESDMAIVVFTDRMGTPTPDYPSGTAEEIALFLEDGKEIAVFENQTPRPPISACNTSAQEQQATLRAYIAEIYASAFVASYNSEADLLEKTRTLLTRLATKVKTEAEAATATESGNTKDGSQATPISTNSTDEPIPTGGVWPRVELESYQEHVNGKIRQRRRWFLVLESNLPYPVTNVYFNYQDNDGSDIDDFDLGPRLGYDHPAVQILAPQGSQRFSISQSIASPGSALCVVYWTAPDGEEHHTSASVRTVG
ncbi:hypothetical protein [Rathayibacter sp. AY1C4]|uniref:hypothetical protein n=1 Tax=Rathayibacter sp. AY1C4 TaxID=2080537 RepID=UPI0011B0F3B0|nr:hypothetical protein [Rathayibacter sp. AY1C4]